MDAPTKQETAAIFATLKNQKGNKVSVHSASRAAPRQLTSMDRARCASTAVPRTRPGAASPTGSTSVSTARLSTATWASTSASSGPAPFSFLPSKHPG